MFTCVRRRQTAYCLPLAFGGYTLVATASKCDSDHPAPGQITPLFTGRGNQPARVPQSSPRGVSAHPNKDSGYHRQMARRRERFGSTSDTKWYAGHGNLPSRNPPNIAGVVSGRIQAFMRRFAIYHVLLARRSVITPMMRQSLADFAEQTVIFQALRSLLRLFFTARVLPRSCVFSAIYSCIRPSPRRHREYYPQRKFVV